MTKTQLKEADAASLPKSGTLPAADIHIEERETICGICPAGCWVVARLVDGRLDSVRPHTGQPMGMTCKLGEHSPEIVYSPHRLRHPMRRVGPKGSHQFEPITWDEAYDTIVDRLNGIKTEHGPEATAIYTGRGSFEPAMCDVFQPKDVAISSASSVLFPFGSPNTLGVGALCYVSFAMIAPHVTMGAMLMDMDSEIDQSEMIVVWGTNPATDCPPLIHQQILEARGRGAEVVVIDPRRTETAKAGGAEWIPIRPGTDGALALAMIQTLIEEDLYDEDFVKNWTVGFEDLVQYCQHFRPEAVEHITGAPATTIRRLARRMCSARGASPVMYTGLEYSDSGVQAIRATMVLWALAGQVDVPGGRVFRMRQNAFPINREGLIPNPNVKRALGRDRFPIYSAYRGESHAIALPDAVLNGRPYPIRALIVLGGSIITAWPDPALWRKTLGSLDFLVTIDRQLTADAAYADIVLPATTGYEITSYMTYGPLFRIRERLIQPVGEARNDFFILAELAERLGYGHLYPQTQDDLLRYVLKGSGFTLEDVRAAGGTVKRPTMMMQYKKWEKGLLRPDGKPGFDTPSGKFEIASTVLAEHGYNPLPVYTEPGEGPLSRPELTKDFPLVFNSGARAHTDFRSQFHGVAGLVKGTPEPLVTLNTEDAAGRGIADGDLVEVVTPRGRVRYRARVTDDIVRGSIDAHMGGGGPQGPTAWQECNVNELTDIERYDPISGFPVYKALLCDIVRVEGAGDEDSSPKGSPHRKGRGRRRQSRDLNALPSGDGDGERPTPKRTIYLDHNATTPLNPEVLEAMLPYLEETYGNPSSIHGQGIAAHEAVEAARRGVAQALGCTARRIVFTSGGSEADNLALKGVALAHRDRGSHIITSTVEHPAILSACKSLEQQGFEVTYLDVGREGLVDPEALTRAIRENTILVSIMLANNEVGVIQPIKELAALARERGVLFHTDAVQGLGKVPIDVEELAIDLLSISGHKVHGPKGVGALFVRKDVRIAPLIDGGKQERGLRAGTENVAAIAGFAKAAELAVRRLPEMERVRGLRDRLEAGLAELVPGARLNGHRERRLPNTLNMTLPGMRGESLVLMLDRQGIALSSGSACKSGSPDPSHALKALGLSDDEAHCAVRLSLGADNTEDEINETLAALAEVIRSAQSAVRFVPCR